MKSQLYVDIETRSSVPIKLGVRRYVQSEDFTIICACFKLGDSWWYHSIAHRLDISKLPWDVPWVAHNSDFERQCLAAYFNDEKFLRIHWRCTQAKMRGLELPQSLKEAAEFIGAPQKLTLGEDLIRKYSVPNSSGGFEPITCAVLSDFIRYCKRDVEATEYLDTHTPDGRDPIRYLSQTYTMNDRGLPVDVELSKKVLHLKEKYTENLKKTLPINVNSSKQVIAFCQSRGVSIPNIQAKTIDTLINTADVPPEIKRILVGRQYLSLSSTAKYKRIVEENIKCRLHDTFLYFGAHTGRDSGRGIQAQNLPRGDAECAKTLRELTLKTPDFPAIIKNGIRSIIHSKIGFLCGDFSSIETRVLFWLAKEREALIQLKHGADLYILMAKSLYGIHTVTPEQRQVGKGCILGLGFGAGAGVSGTTYKKHNGKYVGLNKFLQQQGLILPPELLDSAVKIYRKKYANIPKYWTFLANKFRASIGSEYAIYKLPSGRRKFFFKPSEDSTGLYYLTARKPVKEPVEEVINGVTMYRRHVYGGALAQTIVQATARDILFAAFDRLTRAGYACIGRFHDEILVESDGKLEPFIKIMEQPPSWMKTIPLKVDAWKGKYYHK